MTRQSSVPPSDDSESSDNENVNSKDTTTTPSQSPSKSPSKNTSPTHKKNNNINFSNKDETENAKENGSINETSKNDNIKMDVDEKQTPPETPKKRKRKLRKSLESRKKNKSDNENEDDPKTGAIIISLYDLLNMSENPFEPRPVKPPDPPSNNLENYNNVPYNYDSQAEDYEMEVEEYLNLEINNIDDLIKIGNDYINAKYDPYKKYNINVYTISKLVKPLTKLQKMIGMNNVKQDVFELLLYQLQEFDNSKDMLHTIIEGEPGVGKTDLAKIMAEIYQEMGYCSNKIVKFVKRSDLVGGYLGQTAIKTQKVLDIGLVDIIGVIIN